MYGASSFSNHEYFSPLWSGDGCPSSCSDRIRPCKAGQKREIHNPGQIGQAIKLFLTELRIFPIINLKL